MRVSTLLPVSVLSLLATAHPFHGAGTNDQVAARECSANLFEGRTLFANPEYARQLDETAQCFIEEGKKVDAARVRTIQNAGSFVWMDNIATLNKDLPKTIKAAQLDYGASSTIVGVVLYNLPGRDCAADESIGELDATPADMKRYKTEFIDVAAGAMRAAADVRFAVILEPDSLGNAVTNQKMRACREATPYYEEGVAYAIAQLQADNIALYVDAAHGGWLGWEDNLAPAAREFAKVVGMSGNATKIRGFSTNVSNYNPFHAEKREKFTEGSPSWDESHYVDALAPHLARHGLPAHFIVDQGRVALPGARKDWGAWCNVAPSGFGPLPGSPVDNPHVDSLVYVKPGGESDGKCGMKGAPAAGEWFNKFAMQLVQNATPRLKPTWK